MWEGGQYISRSQFHYNVALTECYLEEIDKNWTYKEVLDFFNIGIFEEAKKIMINRTRLAAMCRCYLNNGKPSTFADVWRLDL